MWGGRIETGTFWKDARIMVNDRTNGVITVITNDKERFFFGSPGGGDFLQVTQSTVTWSLKRLEHSQTRVHVKSSRAPENIPLFGINEEIVNAVCEFLLSHK
jgi:hypothetical protein